jgi:hypothetical protein
MYDRDYVKTLERELELDGDNRFQGWRLGADRPEEETRTADNNPPVRQPERE